MLEQLHVEIKGPERGAPVLLLHGWGSSAQLMSPLADALCDTYRVYNIDLPGHGRTPPPAIAWGVPEYATLVDEFIRERIGQAVHIVGHSNGGRISLYMAGEEEMAAHIRSLSLISPSGVRPTRSLKYHIRKTAATVLKAPFQLLPARLKEYGMDWLRHSVFWRLLGSSDYNRSQGVMRETFVKTVNFYLDSRLDRIKAPTLLFRGAEDDAISRAQMVVMEKEIPDCALIELEGASHYGYLDKPDIVIPALRHFLHQISLSSTPVDA